jgi:hypothetical protein
MSFGAEVVKQIFSVLGYEIPWRRLTVACLVVLAAFSYLDRADFTAGVISFAQEQACYYERIFAPALAGPNIPKFAVVTTRQGCVLKPVSSPIK